MNAPKNVTKGIIKMYLDLTYHVTEWQNTTVFCISGKPKQNEVKKKQLPSCEREGGVTCPVTKALCCRALWNE